MDALLNWALEYGIFAIFLIIILEYACFPLPSEVVLPVCGAIAYANGYNLLLIILCSCLCGIIGSFFCYVIGYCGGGRIIEWFKSKFPKSTSGIDKATLSFNKYSNLSVCICRVIPLCRTYISFISGVSKQNFISFLLFTFIGTFVWNRILISLGFYFSDNIEIIAYVYNKYKFLFALTVILLFLLFKKKLHKWCSFKYLLGMET